MKKIAAGIIFLAGFMIAVSPGLCKSKNLVYNGGFELKKTEELPSGWLTKIYRGTSAESSFDDVEKHSGTYSYKIKLKPPGGSALLYLDKNIGNIKPGKSYQLTLWIKTQNIGYSPNFIAPAVRYNFAPKKVHPYPTIDLMAEMKGKNGWVQLTMTNTAPPGAKEITLDFMITKGTIWVDDVEITEVSGQ
jgi:carbohydrate binding protein with CBM4/9 domain